MVTQEIRGVWLANRPHSSVLESKDKIQGSLDFLAQKGFNTVFPVVWNQGFTLFPSSVMVSHGLPEQNSFYAGISFDPLREIVEQAKLRKIAVIPWFEYGFAASPIEDGGHILHKKPHWSALDPAGNKVRHGGLTWMNSLDSQVQQFMLDLILEVVRNYEVDGIQGDDRLPALPFTGGYDTSTKNQFNAMFGTQPPLPPASPNSSENKWVDWVKFRADILTQFLEKLFNQIKSINPNMIVSMAPASFPFCFNHLMQDSNTWVNKSIVDFIHPQLYRDSFVKYKREVDSITNTFTSPSKRAQFAPGIAFKANNINLDKSDIINCVKLNRNSGFQGQVFFFYEGLRKNSDEIAIALQTEGGYNTVASLPPPFTTT